MILKLDLYKHAVQVYAQNTYYIYNFTNLADTFVQSNR